MKLSDNTDNTNQLQARPKVSGRFSMDICQCQGDVGIQVPWQPQGAPSE